MDDERMGRISDVMLNTVWFFAGVATFGPRWYAFAAMGIWLARLALVVHHNRTREPNGSRRQS